MPDSLFPVVDAEPEMLGFTTAGMTKGQLRYASIGLHPLGQSLAGNDETCGSCQFVKGRTYKKCSLMANTAGPGTDTRLKWAACSMWRIRI